MADTFGLRVGVEGEREFKQAINDINQSFKVLGSEMALVASQFDKNERSVQSITARNTVLNREIEAQKDKISTLKAALDNSATSFGENDKRTMNWQTQLNKAQAELNGMERELKDNNKALDAGGKAMDTTGQSTNELGKETKNLGGEMESTTKKTSVFGDVLKASLVADAIKAGLTALVDMVKALGAAVKDYVSDSMGMATAAAESQAKLTQVMRNTMDATDDQIQSLVELAAQQEKNGVVSKTAQVTAMAELASFVSKKEAITDMLPVMNDYIAYQYGTTASEEQARNVATALGKAINGNIDGLAKQGFTLTKNQKEWFKTANEAERTAFVIDMVSESMGGVNAALALTDAGKMVQLKAVMDETKVAVGTMANEFKAQIMGQMLPSITALTDAFMGVLRGTGSVDELAASFNGVFSEIANIIETFLPTLLDLGSKLLTALVMGIADNIDIIVTGARSVLDALLGAVTELLPIVMEAVGKLIFGLIEGIIAALPELANAAVQIVTSLANGLAGALPTLIPEITKALTEIVRVIAESLPSLLDAALKIAQGLAEGLLAAIPTLIKALPDIIKAIVSFFVGATPQIMTAVAEMLKSLAEVLPDIIQVIVEVLPEIIDGIITALTDALPSIMEAFFTLLTAVTQMIPEIVDAITTVLPTLIDGLVRWFTEAVPLIAEIGVTLLTALIDNLPEIINPIVEALPKIIEAIVAALKVAMPTIIKAGVELLSSLVGEISTIIDAIVKVLPDIIDAIVLAVKECLPLLIDAGVELFTALVDNLSTIIDTILEALPKIIDSILNGLTEAIPLLIDAGVALLIALVDNLPKIMKTICDALPKIISAITKTLTENIDKIIKAGFDLLVALVQNLPAIIWEIIKAVPKIVEGIVNAFKGLFWKIVDVGGDLIKGIWQGISDMGEWLREKISGFFGGVVDSIKNFFGIHSPSALFRDEVGKSIPLGVAEGIDQGSEKAVKAAAKMAKETYASAKLWIDNYRNDEDYMLREELAMWEELGKQYTKVSKEKVEIDKNIASLRSKIAKESFSDSKAWIDKQKSLGQLSAKEEMDAWARVSERYADGTKEKEDADKNYYAAKKKAEEESFNESKKWMDERKKYGLASIQDEIDFWTELSTHYAEGTKQREEADKALYESKNRLLTEQEKLIQKMESAEEKYAKAVDDRAKAIFNTFGLFDELKQKEEVSSQTLTDNLNAQVRALATWAADFDRLAAKGIDEGLLAELRAMGPSAYAEINALSRMSESELTTYTNLWKQKHALARMMAVEELRGLRKDTDDQLRGLLTDMDNLVKPGAMAVGENLGDSIINGINNRAGAVYNAVQNLANGIINTARAALEIFSPSEIFTDIGESVDQGFINGVLGMAGAVRSAIAEVFSNLGKNVGAGFNLDMSGVSAGVRGASLRSSASGSGSEAGIVNQFNISELVVREQADINRIASQLYRLQQQSQRGRGLALA